MKWLDLSKETIEDGNVTVLHVPTNSGLDELEYHGLTYGKYMEVTKNMGKAHIFVLSNEYTKFVHDNFDESIDISKLPYNLPFDHMFISSTPDHPLFFAESGDGHVLVYSFYVYGGFVFTNIQNINVAPAMYITKMTDKGHSDIDLLILRYIYNVFNSYKEYTEQKEGFAELEVPYRKKGKKKIRTIKRSIIKIGLKSHYQKIYENDTREPRDICWDVMGHYRKVKGFGHDPYGNLIEGKTWVKPHVKGNPNKPKINQVRVV